jgi:hypothetical protein
MKNDASQEVYETKALLTFCIVVVPVILFVGILVFAYIDSGHAPSEELGAAYTEVPAFIETCNDPIWEHTFTRNSDGQIFTVKVSETEYNTWLQKSMTEPGTLPPKLDNYTWIKGVGGKVECTTATNTLSANEYYTLREASATQTPLHVYKEGNKTTTSSTKP